MKKQYIIPSVRSEMLYSSMMIMGVGSGGGNQSAGFSSGQNNDSQGKARAPMFIQMSNL